MASQAVGLSALYDDVQLRILNALSATAPDASRDGELVPLAYTRQALADATGITFTGLAAPLQRLLTAGKITTRVHRPSGRTLYKLP